MNGSPAMAAFVGLEIDIICKTPKSWSRRKTLQGLQGKLFPTHCDIDNQIKALSDAMNKVVFEDDRFVNYLLVRREYGPEDKAVVTVRTMAREL